MDKNDIDVHYGLGSFVDKNTIKVVAENQPKLILDVATGTGDLAFAAQKKINSEKIIGLDLSNGMLEVGRTKIDKRKLNDKLEFIQGDSENLPFEDHYFDAVMVSFGVRNFENLNIGLKEIHRVLKNNGKIIVLEFSKPKSFPIKQSYYIYSKFILPVFGSLISKDKSAYRYLPESVAAFPEGNDFLEQLDLVGFSNLKLKKLSGGIATIYSAKK